MRLDEIFRLDERHQDIAVALDQYRHRDDIFITYSDYPKLGIFPGSSYETPLGIYCYPLKQMYEHVVSNTIPFAGDRQYVIVMQEIIPVPDASTYTDAMLSQDIKKIKTELLPLFAKWYSKFHADHSWGNMKKYIDQINALLEADPHGAKFMKKAKWAEQILQNDPTEVGSFGKRWNWKESYIEAGFSQETIDKIAPLAKEFDEGRVIDLDTARKRLEERIVDWSMEAMNERPCSKFWNITRNFAKYVPYRKPMVAWAALMRKLGYEGFTDRKGRGLIHGNEPTQAVFFSTSAVKMVEILPNVRKKEKPVWEPDMALVELMKKENANIVQLLRKLLNNPKTSTKAIDGALSAIWFDHDNDGSYEKIKPYLPELYKRASDHVKKQTFWHVLDPEYFGPDPYTGAYFKSDW